MVARPMLDHLTSGYVQRAADRFPKQGDREPWINPQNYATDKKMFRKGPVDDGVMQFSAPRQPLQAVERGRQIAV
jgi:hypothetical protein